MNAEKFENLKTNTIKTMQFKPYLLDAYLRWFVDCGATPMLLVTITSACQLPHYLMVQKEILLNISAESTRNFSLNEHGVAFQTRFNQVVHDVFIPYENIQAIRANEFGFTAKLFDFALSDKITQEMQKQKMQSVEQQKGFNLRGQDMSFPKQKNILQLVVNNDKKDAVENLVVSQSSHEKKPSLYLVK